MRRPVPHGGASNSLRVRSRRLRRETRKDENYVPVDQTLRVPDKRSVIDATMGEDASDAHPRPHQRACRDGVRGAHVERWVLERGPRYLQVKTLDVSAHSPEYEETRGFCRRMGFEPIEVFPTLWSPRNPCLQMLKALWRCRRRVDRHRASQASEEFPRAHRRGAVQVVRISRFSELHAWTTAPRSERLARRVAAHDAPQAGAANFRGEPDPERWTRCHRHDGAREEEGAALSERRLRSRDRARSMGELRVAIGIANQRVPPSNAPRETRLGAGFLFLCSKG